MDVRIKHIGLNVLLLPGAFYFIWRYLGEIETGMSSFTALFISSTFGIILATVYSEFLAPKIKQAYFLVTLATGLSLLILIYAFGLNELALVNPFSFNLAFVLFAYSYKDEVIAKLSS